MRVQVTGSSTVADAVRSLLRQQGFIVTDTPGQFGLEIYLTDDAVVEVDGVASPLESAIVNGIASASELDILLRRAGGNQDDRSLVIVVPLDDAEAIERGIMRGMVELAKTPKESRLARLLMWIYEKL